MPTYTVTNSNFNLTAKKQKDLAQGITKVHNIAVSYTHLRAHET